MASKGDRKLRREGYSHKSQLIHTILSLKSALLCFPCFSWRCSKCSACLLFYVLFYYACS
ncbi:hypothetical protein NC653_018507 [Populus alba x Populus x berolinensis]|uniref:Uncharacterized protein n=1 Tax=Populus alba x Populus x berolinensis TaxID=444605 RepID=A0AAD6QGN9_9ROSI|nr:hypothetical protein NC653_018507 [Populus alba x Populus x berolinensis]